MLKVSIAKQLPYFHLNVEFQVDKNQILVLWGSSGAGKTTVLECIAGLRTPDAGRIELNQIPIYSKGERINLPARSRKIGYLFQDYALFPHMTVEKNVSYGLKDVKGEKSPKKQVDYRELLDSFGLLHLINRFPGQLSGGEKQRVALVRALVVQPHLLLLDEPFSALDRNSRSKLRQEIMDLHQEWQIPMIVVSHDEEDAALLGDVIISLGKGQMLKQQLPAQHHYRYN
jgi:molybdate transport system ATP-binding protein